MTQIRDRLPEIEADLEELIDQFKESNTTIALAESCTGGYIAHKITNIPGVSQIFDRAAVTYSNQSKTDILGIKMHAIEEYGAVSQEIAYQMAKNIRENSSTILGVGITGVAGPTGGTEINPVGTVYIAISSEKKTEVYNYRFNCTRHEFKTFVLEKVVELLKSFYNANS